MNQANVMTAVVRRAVTSPREAAGVDVSPRDIWPPFIGYIERILGSVFR